MVIHPCDWGEHLYHLRNVLKELRKAGLTANPMLLVANGSTIPGILHWSLFIKFSGGL